MLAAPPAVPPARYPLGTAVVLCPFVGVLPPEADGILGRVDGVRLCPEYRDPEEGDPEGVKVVTEYPREWEVHLVTDHGEYGWVMEYELARRGY